MRNMACVVGLSIDPTVFDRTVEMFSLYKTHTHTYTATKSSEIKVKIEKNGNKFHT